MKVATILAASTMIFMLAMPTHIKAPQQADAFRIGQLILGNRSNHAYQAFERRLGELGYIDGQKIPIEFRSTGGKVDLLSEFATELADMPVDIIVASGPEAVLKVASAATSTIPIVTMAVNYDPVAKAYVKNFANSGNNVTGVYFMQVTLSAKRLALLKEMLPEVKTVAALWDIHTADQFQATQEVALQLGIALQSIELTNPPYDFDQAIAKASEQGAQALVMLSSPLFNSQREKLVAAAAAHRLPAIYIFPHYVQVGGLMAYGPSLPAMYAYAATYVDKIRSGPHKLDSAISASPDYAAILVATR